MRKILVIEDETSLRDGIRDILSFEGYDVFTAENGMEGIISAVKNLPDLIFCDIMMPEMDGLEVLSQLKLYESTRLIPFIFTTALTDRTDFRVGMSSGADDYITKPFTREDLLNTITAQNRKSDNIEHKIKENLNDLRSRVIAHIPHELITPVSVIMGFSDFLRLHSDSIRGDKLKKIAQAMYESGVRMNQLINQHLKYIQLGAKVKLDIPKEELPDIAGVLTKQAGEFAVKYNRTDDLRLNLCDAKCMMGKEEFDIVISELIDNAFKFSDAGNPVSISCKMENNQSEVSFRNFGRTFPEDSIGKIGAFMQFDRKRYEQQGLGLGLIISKLIVESYGGQIVISSDNQAGTTVIVQLPSASE